MPSDAGSSLITALERAWRAIQKRHPEVPDVLVITGQGDKGRSLTRGHFAPERWQGPKPETGKRPRVHELFVAGERLADGAEQVFQTMLHEAAHGLAQVRGIQDTSRQGRYHNRRFVTLAEELGLRAPKAADGTRGLTDVRITPETADRYGKVIDGLQDAITHSLGKVRASEAPTPPKAPANPRRKYECECPRVVKLSDTAFEELSPILCGGCGEGFTEVLA